MKAYLLSAGAVAITAMYPNLVPAQQGPVAGVFRHGPSAALTNASLKCLDVPYGKYAASTLLELHPCRSQTNQTFIHGRDSRITIGGLCVDAFTPGRNYVQPGDQVGLYGCHNGTNQRWTEKYTNDLTSRYFVVGRNGQELCLERAGQLADGAKLVVNTCTMVENQKWYFTGGVGKR